MSETGITTSHQVDDQVVYDDGLTGADVYTVTAVTAAGLTLTDLSGLVIGQPVSPADVAPHTPADDTAAFAAIAANIEAAATATAPVELYLAAQAGSHVVRLYTVGPASAPLYRVEVTDGVRVVDNLSRSYPSEAPARAAARLITTTLRGLDRLDQVTAA